MTNQTITINNVTYEFVKQRVHTSVRIYKGAGVFLRIGNREDIEKDVSFHKKLLELGFPVAKIVDEGNHENEFYFVEQSVGDTFLAQSFAKEVETNGKISQGLFDKFVNISKEFAKAQVKTITQEKDFAEFFKGIHTDYIHEELPHLREKLDKAFEKLKTSFVDTPFVLTHGDFNAHNIYEKGVIDFEHAFYGPFGFDFVSATAHVFFFPDKNLGLETFRWYNFTQEQHENYLSQIQNVYPDVDLKSFRDDLIFCRAVWATVRMHRYPKFQKWRYELFEQILDTYLSGKSVFEMLINFR